MPLNLINFMANPFCKKCERTGIIFLFMSHSSSSPIWCVLSSGECRLANMPLLPVVSRQRYDFTFKGEMSILTLQDQAIKPSRNAWRQTTSDAATHLKSGTPTALLLKNINLHIYRFRCGILRLKKKGGTTQYVYHVNNCKRSVRMLLNICCIMQLTWSHGKTKLR